MEIKSGTAPRDTASPTYFIVTCLAGVSAQRRRSRRAGSGACAAGRPWLGVVYAALAFATLLLFPTRAAHAQPANDAITSATVVPQLPFTDTISTVDATTALDDPNCAGNGPTVWYSFTPSTDVDVFVEANTFGSEYDTTVSVYTGSPGNLTQLACNDDAVGLLSRVVFNATAGTTYYVMVGAYGSGPGGNLVFTMDFAPPPLDISVTIDPKASFDPATGVAVVSGTVTCSRPVFVSYYAELRQRVGGHSEILGSFGTGVPCDGETPWSATVDPFLGFFKGGQADVTVYASAFDLGEYDEDMQQRNVILTGK
ncbi:hypothetical protein [Sorangium sp. So ce363]|uniref:hypothetical protein n=1 Tax=Sorangium sp. So ce363 TaxID=3133304 RepID=UPI003F5EA2E1